MRTRYRYALLSASMAIFAASLFAPVDTSAGKFRNPFRKKSSVEDLAEKIDRLEGHIDEYGSVIAKQPSVWGEARLTKHRGEFEEIMEAEKGNFKETINAAISRSDQAFLANAFSLSAAISGGTAFAAAPAASQTETTTTISEPDPDDSSKTDPDDSSKTISDPSKMISDFKIINRNKATLASPFGFGGDKGIALEPTVKLDQMNRYLNHLHELRRINEGDDTADAPGYALYLMRIPVSVLPGKKTRTGYGAEITMTVQPHLSDELLPHTFRSLVINDLVDELSLPILRLSEEGQFEPLKNLPSTELTDVKAGELLVKIANEGQWGSKAQFCETFSKELCDYLAKHFGESIIPKIAKELEREIKNDLEPQSGGKNSDTNRENNIGALRAYLREFMAWKVADPKRKSTNYKIPLQESAQRFFKQAVKATFEGVVNAVIARTVIGSNAFGVRSSARRARLALPPSQRMMVYGSSNLLIAGKFLRDFHPEAAADGQQIHLLDAREFLRKEIVAAHDFLALPDHSSLWKFTDHLHAAIRGGNFEMVAKLREGFENAVQSARTGEDRKTEPQRGRITEIFAWAILVESALLNEQVMEDMKRVAAEQGCDCLPTGWVPLYLPDPPAEARYTFNKYVECRWPVHVFAIDPVTQDQNVADSFSRRRELQLALSLAFTSGQIKAENFSRFARRLETDMESIDLNRTIVGFSHGADTFGWRFYPRVQSPEIESNAKVAIRDLLIGGPNRDADIKTRRLEPGKRECVALIVMPSFVPNVILDVRSNWFKLTNPKAKEFDLEETVRLSKTIRTLQDSRAACLRDAHRYRDGEVWRLARAVDQLEKRLPLQTARVQVPLENTLGGFQMFANGLTDLGPELIGFYGQPGIESDDSTTLFLVGKNFSVHDTKVVAGGKLAEFTLLSREVMQVTVPTGTNSFKYKDKDHIDVHIATPYGVSAHLHIPVITKDEEEKEEEEVTSYKWDTAETTAQVSYKAEGGALKTLSFNDGTLTLKDGSTNPRPFHTKYGQVAFFVYAKPKDGEKQKLKEVVVGPLDVEFLDDATEFKIVNGADGNNGLVAELSKALQKKGGEFGLKLNAEELELEGYFRAYDVSAADQKGDKDGLPVVKLGNVLKIKLEELPKDCCDPQPLPSKKAVPPSPKKSGGEELKSSSIEQPVLRAPRRLSVNY